MLADPTLSGESHIGARSVTPLDIQCLSLAKDAGTFELAPQFRESKQGESMKRLAIDLDNFSDDVFYHLERRQDGSKAHGAVYSAEDHEQAAERVIDALRPLIRNLLFEVDDDGNPISCS